MTRIPAYCRPITYLTILPRISECSGPYSMNGSTSNFSDDVARLASIKVKKWLMPSQTGSSIKTAVCYTVLYAHLNRLLLTLHSNGTRE